MGATAAVFIGAATAYGAHEAREMRKDQEREAKKQTKAMEREAKAAEQARKNAPGEATQAQNRQRRQTQGTVGRGDTILTSPLGETGSAPTARKTLLGS